MRAAADWSAGLTIDRFHHEVRIDGERVRLTYREFELLCYLAARPRRPVSRAELMREVWHDRAPGGECRFGRWIRMSDGYAPSSARTQGC